ncbi:hypothetical protein H8356DRAFT_1354376 [Neocallimastix lanati (nom. inval.)]|nr:hypothetical protein H8356DRAFT_1354376 [Neocallimastix sp. JGI-2020a]
MNFKIDTILNLIKPLKFDDEAPFSIKILELSKQHQKEEDDEGPIRDEEDQYLCEQSQEINLGFNERKRKALKEIEHGNNKKKINK